MELNKLSMAVGVCQLCGEIRELVEAHIIPLAFFRASQDGPETPALVNFKYGDRPKRLPKGVYDSEIVCDECERSFSSFDDYGFKFLIERSKGVLAAELPEFSTYTNVDYDKLKLFMIALLWRAGVSTQVFYQSVKLGAHRARLAHLLKSQSPGSADDYAVVLGRYTGTLAQMVVSPTGIRLEGRRWYKFRLAEVFAYIKCDAMPVTEPFSGIMLRPHEPLHIMAREFTDSREFDYLRRTAKKLKRPKWFPPV